MAVWRIIDLSEMDFSDFLYKWKSWYNASGDRAYSKLSDENKKRLQKRLYTTFVDIQSAAKSQLAKLRERQDPMSLM